MFKSLTDVRLPMLHLAKRHLALPGKDDEGLGQRNDIAMLIDLDPVAPNEAGFRIMARGEECRRRAEVR